MQLGFNLLLSVAGFKATEIRSNKFCTNVRVVTVPEYYQYKFITTSTSSGTYKAFYFSHGTFLTALAVYHIR